MGKAPEADDHHRRQARRAGGHAAAREWYGRVTGPCRTGGPDRRGAAGGRAYIGRGDQPTRAGRTMTRKKKPAAPREPQERVELRAPADWVRRLDAAAASLGQTRSAFCRAAVTRAIEAREREQGGRETGPP